MAKRSLSPLAIFALLITLCVALPLMIQAIFPKGSSRSLTVPPEESISQPDSRKSTSLELHDSYAWLSGGPYSNLEGSTTEAGLPVEPSEARLVRNPDSLDLSPGIFAGYIYSWDNFDVRRWRYFAGAFFYIMDHTRVQASLGRLRFSDLTGHIYGHFALLEAAHRIKDFLFLEEGLEWDDYEGFNNNLNGYMRATLKLFPNFFLSLGGQKEDMVEQLQNIRDNLRLTSFGPSFYWQMHPRWWLYGYANWGHYTDENDRFASSTEVGYLVSPKKGFSIAAGWNTFQFESQKSTYWSPDYYGSLYARFRLTKNYLSGPFEPKKPEPNGMKNRFGYLAEYTIGVSQRGYPEQTVRAGLEARLTKKLSIRPEFYHLESSERFDSHYSENRADIRAEWRF